MNSFFNNLTKGMVIFAFALFPFFIYELMNSYFEKRDPNNFVLFFCLIYYNIVYLMVAIFVFFLRNKGNIKS